MALLLVRLTTFVYFLHVTVVVALASQTPFAASQRGSQIIDAELTKYIKELITSLNVPGVSLGIVRPDGEVEFGAWGNRTEDGDPVAPGTLFNLGSCSKAFLSAAAGILMEDFATGRNTSALPSGLSSFDWETKIKDLLPDEWETEDRWITEKANVRDVLSHVSGLPSHDLSYSFADSTGDILARMKFLRTAFELREQYEYNNQMYMLVAHIISKFSPYSYREFVHERIFKPIGMKFSTLSPNEAAKTGNFTQAWEPSGRRIPFFFGEDAADLVAGAGGVISTVEDMSLWLKVLLNRGVDPESNNTIVPRSTYEATTSALALMSPIGPATVYGMGWAGKLLGGRWMVTHNGGAPGVATTVSFFPSQNLAIVVLTNSGSPFSQLLTYKIVESVFGESTFTERNTGDSDNIQTTSEPQRSADTPPLPLSAYAGSYRNLGYGTISLCDHTHTSTYCREVISNFSTVDSAKAAVSADKELYAAWPRFWSTHVRLTHAQANEFNIFATYLYPTGYGANRAPFELVDDNFKANFLVEDGKVSGFGLFGSINSRGGQTWRLKRGGNVRDTAEVWFDKV